MGAVRPGRVDQVAGFPCRSRLALTYFLDRVTDVHKDEIARCWHLVLQQEQVGLAFDAPGLAACDKADDGYDAHGNGEAHGPFCAFAQARNLIYVKNRLEPPARRRFSLALA